jgi:hypothetical protein
MADTVLERMAVERREIEADPLKTLDAIPNSTDPAALWKGVRPAVENCFKDLHNQLTLQREELEVLWWFFSRFSRHAGKSVQEVSAGAAAMCCGVELAERTVLPPLVSTRYMVRRAVEDGRKKGQLSAKTLVDVVAEWTTPIAGILAPKGNVSEEIASEYPWLLPLSWLSSRLMESGIRSGWESEFELKTGVPASTSLSPCDWAVQAFNERIAQRIIDDQYAEDEE